MCASENGVLLSAESELFDVLPNGVESSADIALYRVNVARNHGSNANVGRIQVQQRVFIPFVDDRTQLQARATVWIGTVMSSFKEQDSTGTTISIRWHYTYDALKGISSK